MNNKITARKIEGFKPSVLNDCVCHNEMNKLEKAFEEIEGWHLYSEQEGFVAEEEISYLDYVKKHINNLQSKIDKAIEVIDLITPELWNISNKMTYRLKDVKNILKEDK